MTPQITDWEHIGNVAVDSGRIVLGDPCHVKLDDLRGLAGTGQLEDQLSVLCSAGFGDGLYPVDVRWLQGDPNKWGGDGRRVAELRITFIDVGGATS